MASPREVVIIGGSYAGILAAKSFLNLNDSLVVVTVISNTTHNFFNVAAPRLLIEPGIISQTVFPIEESLKKYAGKTSFQFINGKADKVDFEHKSITVLGAQDPVVVLYDYLVIASGTKTEDKIFKVDGDYKETTNSIEKLAEKVKSSHKVVILGGGSTGVEVAGELGYAYGKTKDITLYTGGEGPTLFLGKDQSHSVEKKLTDLNVNVVNNLRYDKFDKLETGNYHITLSNGETVETEVLIVTTGTFPNSEFIDQDYLDEKGYLKTDEHLRVVEHPNVMGLGDIVSISQSSLVDLDWAQKGILNSIIAKEFQNKDVPLKSYATPKPTQMIPISRNGGVGLLLGWKLPNFFVRFIKARNYMIPNAPGKLS